MKNNDLVLLRRFSSAGEAAIFRSLLESADIRVVTTGELVNDVYPIGETWAGIDVWVAPEDVEKAREVLSARFDEREFEREAERSGNPDSA